MFSTKIEQSILLMLLAGIAGAYKLGLQQTDWWLEKTDSAIVANGTYVTREQLEKLYLSKDSVAEQYVSKLNLEKSYVPIEDYRALQALNNKLKEKSDTIDAALVKDNKTLVIRQLWHPKNPEFYIKFSEFYESDLGPIALIDTSFSDSEPYSYRITKFNTPKIFTFAYNGRQYELKATLKKQKDEITVEVNLREVTP